MAAAEALANITRVSLAREALRASGRLDLLVAAVIEALAVRVLLLQSAQEAVESAETAGGILTQAAQELQELAHSGMQVLRACVGLLVNLCADEGGRRAVRGAVLDAEVLRQTCIALLEMRMHVHQGSGRSSAHEEAPNGTADGDDSEDHDSYDGQDQVGRSQEDRDCHLDRNLPPIAVVSSSAPLLLWKCADTAYWDASGRYGEVAVLACQALCNFMSGIDADADSDSYMNADSSRQVGEGLDGAARGRVSRVTAEECVKMLPQIAQVLDDQAALQLDEDEEEEAGAGGQSEGVQRLPALVGVLGRLRSLLRSAVHRDSM